MAVAIFDYGVGNIFSLRAAFSREGVESLVTADMGSVREADALVLPGVGGFASASSALPKEEIRRLAGEGKPLIGICLGLQLFFEESEEGPGAGLGLFPGKVRRLPPRVKVPHMGWNTVTVRKRDAITDGVADGSWVYYAHSYHPPEVGDGLVATTDYGVEYPALVRRKNVVGLQFHPEKSGAAGRRILRNILKELV
ncbi:MAG: imidazole glycerol phosphate synthase subunit HisH [Nitrososphaerota archaeon]|nr:imidazole glycerol phosphate synthase subunit HisH [Nitrososphaerota archaeon]